MINDRGHRLWGGYDIKSKSSVYLSCSCVRADGLDGLFSCAVDWVKDEQRQDIQVPYVEFNCC